MTKKWFCLAALSCVTLVAHGAGRVVSSSASGKTIIDTRAGKGAIPSDGTEALRYSNLWNGDASATVTLAQDSVPLAEGLAGEGAYEWSAPSNGTYTLTHTTYTNGVKSAVETATLMVKGSSDTSYAYYVVDLSEGVAATTYPVHMLRDVPKGGWTDEYKTTKLVLRRIEAGSISGINAGLADSFSRIEVTKSYYVGVFEVTQKQWELVMGDNPSFDTDVGDIRPVNNVSYDMIRGTSKGGKWPSSSTVDEDSFMGRLRQKTGFASFDLPTEAQWEYACRAGTTSKYNNGGDDEDDLKRLGRYVGNTNDMKGGYSTTTVVGSYEPNKWGFYDMHGNVFEWCRDWYGALSTSINPVGATSGGGRVARGGYYTGKAYWCYSGKRHQWNPSVAGQPCGFRISCAFENIVLEEDVSFKPFVDGDVSVTGWTGKYDGAAHGASVAVADGITDATVKYACTSNGESVADEGNVGVPPSVDLAWTVTSPVFTDAGAYTVWCAIAAPGYLPVTNSATISISKRAVTLTSGSASKVYDGTPVTCGDIHVAGDGFASGEGATYTVTGSQTVVGESTNTFAYALNENTKAANYTITTAYGTLAVTPATLDADAVFGGGETDEAGRIVCVRVYNGAPQPFEVVPNFGEPYRILYALAEGDESAYSETAPTRTHVAEGDLVVRFRLVSHNYAPHDGTGVLRIVPKILAEETANYAGVALTTPYEIDFEIFPGPDDPPADAATARRAAGTATWSSASAGCSAGRACASARTCFARSSPTASTWTRATCAARWTRRAGSSAPTSDTSSSGSIM